MLESIEGGALITEMRLQWKLSTVDTFPSAGTDNNRNLAPNEITETVTGLTDGGVYDVRLRVTNEVGAGFFKRGAGAGAG